ncbi:MAG: 16S rRNA (guanine(527)-N(7))-methyltransferase RsmG [Erythrobacter sp. RIFCSPHIGHO2_12_FULL_63_10]|nr:MAG: 16S rRNA (guanine(527)-N(7))-methyltransferase RsmG [Erythrobacter sp. RIFCSPHIGHO2_12_FULL_63_10]
MIEDEGSARRYVAGLADGVAMDRLDRLVAALVEENRRQNLISRPTEASIWQRHVADSAQLLRFVPRETFGPWLDLGTGAGFPGLVIAILRPAQPMVLVESRPLRAEWLARMAEELALDHCRIEARRIEMVEAFAARVISARAFAPLLKLLSLSAPFSTGETTYLLPKGRSAAQELTALPVRSRELFHVEQSLTDPDAGIIVSS